MKLKQIDTKELFSHQHFDNIDIDGISKDLAEKNNYRYLEKIYDGTAGAEVISPDQSIENIPPNGVVIIEKGSYTFGKDIVWEPVHNGAAIYICCDDVDLNLNGHSLTVATESGLELETIGVYVVPSTLIVPLRSSISIHSGKILDTSLYGILAVGVKKLNLTDLTISDCKEINPFSATMPAAGVEIALSENIILKNCTISDLTKTAWCFGGFQIIAAKHILITNSTVSQLTNCDGPTAAYNFFDCVDIKMSQCRAEILKTHYLNKIDTIGHTCIGFLYTQCQNGTITECVAHDIKGCCDDTHGMSIFISADFNVANFTAKNILDGDCACMTGAKATGLEIYGCNINIKNSTVENIKAVRPQDLQSAGFSCWGALIVLDNCVARSVAVLNKNKEPDTSYGYGVGFGWAPDPRSKYRGTDAFAVTYMNCRAEHCQVGFDTWKHMDSFWIDIALVCCMIPILKESVGSIRTFTMDFCSESPTGMPYSAEIMNTAENNTFSGITCYTPSGVSYPPLCPENSWSVPRVSLPGLFSMQPQFASEWWYYAGWAKSSDGTYFSIQVQLLRSDITQGLAIGGSLLGIGWDKAAKDQNSNKQKYLFAQGYGLGASSCGECTAWTKSLQVQNADDHSFKASFKPFIEIVDPSMGAGWGKISTASKPTYSFSYLSSSEKPLGHAGSQYQLQGGGTGSGSIPYSFIFSLEDKRGVVMEGLSGYVGAAMFKDKNASAQNDSNESTSFSESYECAQPQLKITDGSLQLGKETFTLIDGNLWMDRQMITQDMAKVQPSIKSNEELQAELGKMSLTTKALYRGNWIGLTLNNSISLALAVFWNEHSPQWIVGTKVGRPAKNGFGNIFLASGEFPYTAHNGGVYLQPKLKVDQPESEWDFDINILNPSDPSNSPHWKSAFSGHTYATALEIDFSPRAQQYGLPSSLYLYAIVDICENTLPLNSDCFFEGAAKVFDKKLRDGQENEEPVGYAFIEEMGYN